MVRHARRFQQRYGVSHSRCSHVSLSFSVRPYITLIRSTYRICWPFRAEQPTNTLHVTHNLDIAYELFEVRTGPDASRPIFTLGRAPRGTLDAVRTEACAVLGRAFGADGERKRANVQRMKADVLAAWAEGGSASEAVRSLVGAFKGR